MRIVLFCENQYAIDILNPIQIEADREGNNEVLWYVHEKKIPCFPLKNKVRSTTSIQETFNFMPEAVFVPGNWHKNTAISKYWRPDGHGRTGFFTIVTISTASETSFLSSIMPAR